MNLLSVFLGFTGLFFGFRAFRKGAGAACCAVSLGACGGALLCQLAEMYRLTVIGDTSAIYDTARARLLAAACLLGLTLGLQLLALVRRRTGIITKP